MPASQVKALPLIAELLKLTEKLYDDHNAILEQIKSKLPFDAQVATFNQILSEELPLTTARRAFRTAIRVAMGEQNVYREPKPFVPAKVLKGDPKKKVKK